MRYLTRHDVQQALTMADAIDAVRKAFIQLSIGEAQVPPRASVALDAHQGLTLFMPGFLAATQSLAVKIVSVHERNHERNLPRINALVLLIDPATGLPLAMMEGGYLTAIRTGAASGVATDLLAKPDATTAAIFGAGAQARTQALAVAAVRDIRRFRVYARTQRNIHAMLAELKPQLGDEVELVAAKSPTEAIAGADIICAATSSLEPVFDGAGVQVGTHVNATGSYQPHMQEIDIKTLLRASKIVVDSREAAAMEAGDLLIAIESGALSPDKIYAEIGDIAAGLKPGRETSEEITYFKSVGNAVQDAAVAQLVYQRAIHEGIGTEIDFC
jgi:alanine dehydrogenase